MVLVVVCSVKPGFDLAWELEAGFPSHVNSWCANLEDLWRSQPITSLLTTIRFCMNKFSKIGYVHHLMHRPVSSTSFSKKKAVFGDSPAEDFTLSYCHRNT